MVIAAEAASPYTGPVVILCLVLGTVLLIAGAILAAVFDIPAERAARSAAAKADAAAGTITPGADGKVDAEAQAAVVDVVGAVSELASALKDLTTPVRLMVLGAVLVLTAAVASGADAIGDAGGDSPATEETRGN